jgi:hypothetical protein
LGALLSDFDSTKLKCAGLKLAFIRAYEDRDWLLMEEIAERLRETWL